MGGNIQGLPIKVPDWGQSVRKYYRILRTTAAPTFAWYADEVTGPDYPHLKLEDSFFPTTALLAGTGRVAALYLHIASPTC